MCDASLFFGGDAQFCAGFVVQAFVEEREHLAGALAGGADDEDVAEAALVIMIGSRQFAERLAGCAARAALLLCSPVAGGGSGRGLLFADLRMRAEGFEPVGRI